MIESIESKIEKKFSEIIHNDDMNMDMIEVTTPTDDHRRFMPALSLYRQMVNELTREERLECIVYELLNFVCNEDHQPRRIKRRKQYKLDLSDIQLTIESLFPTKEGIEIENIIFK